MKQIYKLIKYRLFDKNFWIESNVLSRILFFTLKRFLSYFILIRNYFFLTNNQKQLAKFKNIHNGKTVYIFGNGPSLKDINLDKFKDEITFASNKIFLLFDFFTWRPTYYTVEDDLVLKQNKKQIYGLEVKNILFPYTSILYLKKLSKIIYFNFFQNSFFDAMPKFSNNPISGLYWGGSVIYTQIQLAAFMGAKKIILLGVDFNFNIPSSYENSTKTIVSRGEINHFSPEYRKKGEKWNIPNLDLQEKSYEKVLDYCQTNNIEIYNATRGTHLKIIPKTELNQCFYLH